MATATSFAGGHPRLTSQRWSFRRRHGHLPASRRLARPHRGLCAWASGEPAKPGIGFWFAIAASAIAGTVNMLTRPDFDLGDLVIPGIFTAILVGSLLSVRVFWPQALGDPERNSGLVIGFMIGMVLTILLLAAGDLR